jgi:Secretion system C-terminal sorting domain
MKNKLFPLFLFLSLFAHRLDAQSVEFLDANNIRSGYMPGATLFMTDSNVYNSYEVPKGSGIRSIFASNFWISGLDQGGNLIAAAAAYNNNSGFSYGPVAINYNALYDSTYKKVFKITQPEINYHIAHHNDAGYIPSVHIAQWPGNGNTANGEAAILASFTDVNSNGIYEPLLGDYPDICGDEAIFIMMNDSRPGVNTCAPMGVELHVLAYANAGTAPVSNTTFVKIKVFNRSGVNYHGVYFSNFVDNDLGCANNDRVGCDTAGNYFYTYNGVVQGSVIDGGSVCPTSEIGYGTQKVAQATVFLDQKMSSFGYFINGASSAMRDPSSCDDYRNYQTAHWASGAHFAYGGNGYPRPSGTVVNTDYIFPGDPTDTAQWSELNTRIIGPMIAAGDRRSIGSVYLNSLHAGGTATIDMAYVTSFAGSTAHDLGELTVLRQDIQSLHQAYAQGTLCAASGIFTGLDQIESKNRIYLYPNPTTGIITIESDDLLESLSVSDLQGRELVRKKLGDSSKVIVDLSHLTHGVYLVNVKDASGRISTRKILVD